MKFLAILSAVVFAAFAVAGPVHANDQDESKMGKRDRWDVDRIKRLLCDMNGTAVSATFHRRKDRRFESRIVFY
ncbi:hypothetical protein AN5256.2 [Aspergillus nidulans FGSC A4]|uniref:Uncharacterized protein n=1 Tax=Emericella nidulans (strain FGSC A4 / ATCC 38163 / CBS 112.46 / NRRL 194 / M139) TaxID=227321 RepID=Q5B2H4_EMENI|nr:hypothetical protein [Aspergillus nidulans FGSC A4]EAA62206.1 hypothetical protein AN5256.2 [Aspergillus nidulans FGSC A4]CBF82233.1 TPA: hypothetical protein ANIA_05256 [Aspergillus nidulans FGSC A4]|eukprot:XP_662860.1 hypothetical protein AN5256.2 [Aspergillus nidulans FGSC A4]